MKTVAKIAGFYHDTIYVSHIAHLGKHNPKEGTMDKKSQLKTAYGEYVSNRQKAIQRNMYLLLAISVVGSFLLLKTAIDYIRQPGTEGQGAVMLMMMLVVIPFAAGLWNTLVRAPRQFKESQQWSQSLLEYMETSGVNTETLSPTYVHYRTYKGENTDGSAGWNPDILYKGRATVDGKLKSIEVLRSDETVSVYADKTELMPGT